jgi:hypothetical protein
MTLKSLSSEESNFFSKSRSHSPGTLRRWKTEKLKSRVGNRNAERHPHQSEIVPANTNRTTLVQNLGSRCVLGRTVTVRALNRRLAQPPLGGSGEQEPDRTRDTRRRRPRFCNEHQLSRFSARSALSCPDRNQNRSQRIDSRAPARSASPLGFCDLSRSSPDGSILLLL